MKTPYILFAAVFTVLVAGVFFIPATQSQEVPKTTTKVITKIIEPKPEPDSFLAQPKTLWRAGTKYARIAEAPDSKNRIQALVIVNEPDAWMINLFSRSGRHVVDPGPTFNAHLPIFEGSSRAKTRVAELEFGRELEFFAQNNARRLPGEVINSKPSERQELTLSDARLVLWTDAQSKKPVRVSLIQGREIQTIEYLSYEDNLKFDPSLFQPPAGIAFQESK